MPPYVVGPVDSGIEILTALPPQRHRSFAWSEVCYVGSHVGKADTRSTCIVALVGTLGRKGKPIAVILSVPFA